MQDPANIPFVTSPKKLNCALIHTEHHVTLIHEHNVNTHKTLIYQMP